MEFPDLGKNCALSSCNRLDFLPFRCHYCNKNFCENHWKVAQHNCANKHLVEDRRVPSCPLCGAAIAVRRGEDPNVRVDAHIRGGCKKAPGTTSKVAAYKEGGCAFARCNGRVLVQSRCQACGGVFCLKHRLENDHNCVGKKSFTKRIGATPGSGKVARKKKDGCVIA